jgi:hypothetical protein
MGSRSKPGRPEGEEVYRLIAHAASLNRAAADAFHAGRLESGIALLEQAELLTSDVTCWIDEIEAEEAAQFGSGPDSDFPKQGNGLIQACGQLFSGRVKHLGIGLGAGLAVGVAVSQL